ncbi:MAG: cardiolipin synthase [Clostridia bacterium]|nr:cardiolipin synthase [Clostridia bacterium]
MKNGINLKGKIKQSDHIFALKIKTESNGLGHIKTMIVMLLIALQLTFLILSYFYLATVFQTYLLFSVVMSLIACVHVLSSDYHGQAKAMWVLFLLISFGFGYIMYFLSGKKIMFAKSRKKINQCLKETEGLKTQGDINLDEEVKVASNYLYNAGNFVSYNNSKTTYFPSGASFFDDVIEQMRKAKEFIFLEYFIVSNGVLLTRIIEILKQKVSEGVDVRIIYDDMGSHRTLKRKTKKQIIKAGIKLQSFNRLVPIFNIALNLRDHRKIVIIDGKVSYTGGVNLADEYINEKRMHGYWKDEGIKIEGEATDSLTLAFLVHWEFLTKAKVDYSKYINKASNIKSDGIVVPFVSGPNYPYSISQNIYLELISSAKEKLYIMTPYFIPDETILNAIVNKAKSGVDVRLVLPSIADKKFVYIVTRNNAEKIMDYGVKIYTMENSFVHSKVIVTESMAVVGSINVDLRSFNQQFESAVLTNEKHTLKDIKKDFDFVFEYSKNIEEKDKKRNKVSYRALAGLFNIISPFM